MSAKRQANCDAKERLVMWIRRRKSELIRRRNSVGGHERTALIVTWILSLSGTRNTKFYYVSLESRDLFDNQVSLLFRLMIEGNEKQQSLNMWSAPFISSPNSTQSADLLPSFSERTVGFVIQVESN